jgi:hypothetical protein
VRTLLVAAALVVVGCGGSTGGANPSPAQFATEIPLAGSFATLPFTLDFPDGWVFGTAETLSEAVTTSDPKILAWVEEAVRQSASTSNMFVAINVGSDDTLLYPAVSGVTMDIGDTPVAGILDEYERQNVEGVAKTPGIEGKVSSDRIQLPIGETVRVRWRNVLPADSRGTGDTSSTGYAFLVDTTIYTFVFSAATETVGAHEPEWEEILGTFKVKPAS